MVIIFFKKTAQSAVFDKVFGQAFFKKLVGAGEARGFLLKLVLMGRSPHGFHLKLDILTIRLKL